MLEALVFDAYGTVFDVNSLYSRCEEAFPSRGERVADLWRSKQLEYTWLWSLMNRYEDFWKITRDALRFACRSLELSPADDQIEHVMQGYLSLAPFGEMTAALEALDGLPCSILSNGTPAMLEGVLRSAGLAERFQHVLSADEVRIYKPSPAVYELALARLDLRREQIGFVSSNAWDACGAKAFGFRVFWLNRRHAAAEVLGVAPDATLHSAMELAPAVRLP